MPQKVQSVNLLFKGDNAKRNYIISLFICVGVLIVQMLVLSLCVLVSIISVMIMCLLEACLIAYVNTCWIDTVKQKKKKEFKVEKALVIFGIIMLISCIGLFIAFLVVSKIF